MMLSQLQVAKEDGRCISPNVQHMNGHNTHPVVCIHADIIGNTVVMKFLGHGICLVSVYVPILSIPTC